mgnify:CR=1 FL=1
MSDIIKTTSDLFRCFQTTEKQNVTQNILCAYIALKLKALCIFDGICGFANSMAAARYGNVPRRANGNFYTFVIRKTIKNQ